MLLFFQAFEELYPEKKIIVNYSLGHSILIVANSASKYNEKTGTFYNYDWRDINIPYEEIEELIKLAEEKGGM